MLRKVGRYLLWEAATVSLPVTKMWLLRDPVHESETKIATTAPAGVPKRDLATDYVSINIVELYFAMGTYYGDDVF